MSNWLEGLPCRRATFIPWSSATLPVATIAVLEKLSIVSTVPIQEQTITNIAPQSVYMIAATTGDVLVDATTEFRLGDYVVVVRSGVIPLQGSHGLPKFVICIVSCG